MRFFKWPSSRAGRGPNGSNNVTSKRLTRSLRIFTVRCLFNTGSPMAGSLRDSYITALRPCTNWRSPSPRRLPCCTGDPPPLPPRSCAGRAGCSSFLCPGARPGRRQRGGVGELWLRHVCQAGTVWFITCARSARIVSLFKLIREVPLYMHAHHEKGKETSTCTHVCFDDTEVPNAGAVVQGYLAHKKAPTTLGPYRRPFPKGVGVIL